MRALFVTSIVHYGREHWPVLRHFAERGAEVHVLVGWRGPTSEEFAARCAASGMTVHRVPGALAYEDKLRERGHDADAIDPSGAAGLPDAERRASSSLRRRVGLWVYTVASFFGLLRTILAARRFTAHLVAQIDPDVILGGPNRACGTFDEGIARQASRRRIPYCCIPMSPYLGEYNAVEARFSNVRFGMLQLSGLDARISRRRRALARAFPLWTREQDGVRIFSWDPKRMLAARLAGLIAENPWRQPADAYDVCYAESAFAEEMLVAGGYPPEKIVVAGKPMLDGVYAHLGDREHEAALYGYLELRDGEPFILLNVEPSFEHEYASWGEHWERFTGLMEGVARTGLPVVLSLHPLCDPRNYRYVEAAYGFKLSERYKIAELYPYCGVSVSFPCSTNLLAAPFGRPLVIYDWYGMTRDDYPRVDVHRLPGALLAYDVEEVVRQIGAVTPPPPFGREDTIREPGPACATIYADVERRLGL